jgi:tetratricopeptide (TPR) repeat protein
VTADPTNPALLENVLAALLGQGEVDAAIPVADQIVALGIDSQFAHMVQSANAAQSGDWDSLLSNLEAGQTIGPLVDGLAQGWAEVGKGQMSQAIAAFDAVIAAPGLKAFGLYHKALALASVGDYEGADAIFALPATDGMQHTRQSSIAHAQVLSLLGRNDAAVAMIDATFGNALDPSLAALRSRLAAGEAVPFTFVGSAEAGLAEVYYSVAMALGEDTPDAYKLIYGRIAQYLAPQNTEVNLLVAALLERMGRYDLANATYDLIARDDPSYLAAELGRAAVLRKAGQAETAVEVLQQLAESQPDSAVVQATLGDTLRGLEQFTEANVAYTRALDLYGPTDRARWFVLYTRGITLHRLDQWPAAEADFRASLALNPGQAQVLNYLGYSLVEEGKNLDEALGMIEQAVAAQPDNGAVVDSLGWVLFQLGRYDESVVHMERAAALEPVDAVVNDHLGDVYWAVGRVTEAQFQWRRALSFDPEAAEALRIRAKLADGLDAVLANEGADPLHLAQEASP